MLKQHPDGVSVRLQRKQEVRGAGKGERRAIISFLPLICSSLQSFQRSGPMTATHPHPHTHTISKTRAQQLRTSNGGVLTQRLSAAFTVIKLFISSILKDFASRYLITASSQVFRTFKASFWKSRNHHYSAHRQYS